MYTALLGILPSDAAAFLPCFCRGTMQGPLCLPSSSHLRVHVLTFALVALLAPYVLWSLYGISGLQSVPTSAVIRHTCTGMICRAARLQQGAREDRTSSDHLSFVSCKTILTLWNVYISLSSLYLPQLYLCFPIPSVFFADFNVSRLWI